MQAYELLARLKHLTLCGVDEDGELEWIGTRQAYDKVENEIEAFENGWVCGDASNHNNGEDDCAMCGVIKSGI
jgi:hypothetical protein